LTTCLFRPSRSSAEADTESQFIEAPLSGCDNFPSISSPDARHIPIAVFDEFGDALQPEMHSQVFLFACDEPKDINLDTLSRHLFFKSSRSGIQVYREQQRVDDRRVLPAPLQPDVRLLALVNRTCLRPLPKQHRASARRRRHLRELKN
jgi:hypothetical protein